jgi:hypothetical protein
MDTFLARHRDKVTAVLDCHDRIVFHGHLPINYPQALGRFLRGLGVGPHNYAGFVHRQSERLREAAEQLAAAHRRPCLYLKHRSRKEDWAHRIAERDHVREGLVGVLRITEMGRSFSIRQGRYGPGLVSTPRRGLRLYFYFIDPQLGWLHLRLQTWFPFLIQVAVNGHDILARHLDRAGVRYQRHENGFRWIEDPRRAQQLARRVLNWNWSRLLDRVARRTNPLLADLLRPFRYRWVIDQCELSTDLLFHNPAALGPLYRRLTQHASLCFDADDILGFLGRSMHGLFQGEVYTEYHHRDWGVRLKHRVGKNWIKMYNKGGSILRVETVINRPQDFRIWRTIHRRDGSRRQGLAALPKAVHYLPRYWDIQTRANRHYLEALAAVEDPTRAYAQLDQLASPVTRDRHRCRGLNPLARSDRELLSAVARAEHHLQGFRNEHIRIHLQPKASPDDPRQRKRQSAQVRRKLLILRHHGLIKRIPTSRRYRLTRRGSELISAALYYQKEDLCSRLMPSAA